MEHLQQAEYTLSEQEYVAACKLHMELPLRTLLVCIVLLLLLTILGTAFWATLIQELAYGAVIGIVAGYVLAFKIVLPWRTRHQYRNYLAVREPVMVNLKENGIYFSSSMGQVDIDWDHLLRWRTNEELILIYQAPAIYHVIPRHIGELAEHITTALSSHIGAAS